MITKSGIYCICNLVNGKIYIGQTADFKLRWRSHIKRFNRGSRSANPHLLSAWRKYGPEAFVFEVIEYVPKDKELLKEREQYWMDYLNVTDSEVGYNISPTSGSSLGVKYTEEQKQKMSGENSVGYQHAKCWEYNGKSLPLSVWAKEYNMSQTTLASRVKEMGWPLERALATTVKSDMFGENNNMFGHKGEKSPGYKHAKRYDYDGKLQTLSDWAKEYGINQTTLSSRIKKLGMSIERALTTPVKSRKK